MTGKQRGTSSVQPPYEIGVLPPPLCAGRALLVAAGRAGELPILDAARAGDPALSTPRGIAEEVAALREAGIAAAGLRVDAWGLDAALAALAPLSGPGGEAPLDFLIIAGWQDDLSALAAELRPLAKRLFREAVSEAEALEAEGAGLDGVVAKGNESGGRVGGETTFVLLQRLRAKLTLPVWAQGGVGPRSLAACLAAGATGVVLDGQMALAAESALAEPARSLVASMDGSETVCLGEQLGRGFRVHRLHGATVVRDLKEVEDRGVAPAEFTRALEAAFRTTAGEGLLPIGQDASFASALASSHCNAAGILRAYRQGAADSLRSAAEALPFAEGSPMALALGTRYPLVQGPMTRVSDGAPFARAVAREGGLPFLALALMRGAEVERLLEETALLLGEKPWGVGILAFVPPELRAEQIRAVLAARPRFALLAGGRPDQAKALEEAGIVTFLHVPSVRLLDLFLREGHRRFIFEGRECGGHVGPISSFVLWESALRTLEGHRLAHPKDEPPDVLLAGGIRDGLSAGMAGAMAGEAARAGVRVGLLMGSAYLFTREAVETGAIVASFQEEALACRETVILDAEGGHAIRCAPTPYEKEYRDAKRAMARDGLDPETVRRRLEEMNVGRLRIATKGLVRVDGGTVGDGAFSELRAVKGPERRRSGLFMLGQVAALGEAAVAMADLHRDVSAGSCARLRSAAGTLLGGRPLDAAARGRAPVDRDCPVAVVGMACLYPGAPDLDRFWRNVLEKRDLIREVPADRWPKDLFYDPDPSAQDRVISRWGGFLDAVPFDPLRYGIPPTSLNAIMAPHLLMLEVVRRAMEAAGYDRRPLPRERTAVIIGTGGGGTDLACAYGTRIMVEQYLDGAPGLDRATVEKVLAAVRQRIPHPTEDSLAGTLENVTAGRVANRFNFGGPNFTVDAACATSLAALEASVKELRQGTSDVVVAGAADTQDNVFSFLMFSKTGALSRTGRCRPFDAKADGIAISEGIAALILKRLPDALADGDTVYAVVRGVGASSDGRDRSMTAPSPMGQRRALERAYELSGVAPSTVGLVEAHGTGTVVGDRTELATLREVYGEMGARPQSVALGSVKSQIGHTKNAAGLAGLLKVVHALHERVLPPTLLEEPNEAAKDRTSPLYLNTRPRPWLSPGAAPRRAAVSAFGFGGTNFHAVLEEYAPHAVATATRGAELFPFRAPDRGALAQKLEGLEKALARGYTGRFVDLSAAACAEAARSRGECRLSIVATGAGDLQEKVRAAASVLRAGRDPAQAGGAAGAVSFGEGAPPGLVAFLFPGQGSQYPGMLEELALHFPRAREVFEAADRALEGRLPRPLSSFVFPPPSLSPEEEAAARRELGQTWIAQPALGAADLAAYALLQRLALAPDMAGGLSYGEYAALGAAGSLPLGDLLRLSEARGRAVQETQGRDEVLMLAVGAAPERVADLLSRAPGATLAIRNAPQQCVVGGAREAVERFAQVLGAERVSFRKIPMSAGFHIPEARPAARRFAPVLEGTPFASPRFPVYANRTASPHGQDAASIRRVLVEHLTEPIDFFGEVESMYAAGARTFVEVGPGQVLSGLARQILKGKDVRVVALQPRQDGHGLEDFLSAVAGLYASGRATSLEALFDGCELRGVDLSDLPRPEPLPKTAWLVDGGWARPQAGASAPKAQAPAAKTPPAAAARVESGPTPVAAVPAATAPLPNGAAEAMERLRALPVGGGDAAALLGAFQASMRQLLDYQARAEEGRRALMQSFLETQQRVVEAFAASRAATLTGPAVPPVAPAMEPATAGDGDGEQALPEPSDPPVAEVVEAAAAPVEGSADLEDLLMALVSERTGYPREVLSLDQNLEADLGIDSIKRMEIFGLLREKLALPDSPADREDFFLKTGKLRTLGEALAWLKEEGGLYGMDLGSARPPAAPAAARPEGHTPAEGRAPVRCVVEPVPALLRPGRREIPREGLTLLTEDDGQYAKGLAGGLRVLGGRVVSVRHGRGASILGDDRYEVDLLSAEAVDQLRRWVGERNGRVTALAHLLPLQPGEAAKGSAGFEVKTLFHLARAFAEELKEGGTVVAVTALGGDFGRCTARGFSEGAAAIPGFLSSLGREWPSALVKAIDLDPNDDVEILVPPLAAEFFGEDPTVPVGLSSRGRVVLAPAERALCAGARDGVALGPGSVILALGGARGITSAVCAELASRFGSRFVLVGRSPLPGPEASETRDLTAENDLKRALMECRRAKGDPVTPVLVEAEYRALRAAREVRDTLETLSRAGSPVEYVPMDLKDARRIEDLVAQIYERHGRLDGVIHGAGVIEDALLAAKSPDSFARVFDTKVTPATVLARVLRPETLRFLAFFSSVAARFGNEGQTDYAAANEALNALAAQLDRRWPARVVSVGWGPWAERGMASPHLRERLASRGFDYIPLKQGCATFADELLHGAKGETEVLIFSKAGEGPLMREADTGASAQPAGELELGAHERH